LGGKSNSEGLIQVNYNKKWGWVCADQWDKKDADVACRMMGFPRSLSSFKEKEESQERKYPFWLNNIQCSGNDRSLFSCFHRGLRPHNCKERQRAGATCIPKGANDTLKALMTKVSIFFSGFGK